MSLKHFDPDSLFGRGTYRRLLRFVRSESAVALLLDHTHHAMWVKLQHRHGIVTDAVADITRGPATSCSGAPSNLSLIIGAALSATPSEVSTRLPSVFNCTHLSDLTRWAMQAADRPGEIGAEYEIIVPDQTDDAAWIEIIGDGASCHRWLVHGDHIVQPSQLSGAPLFGGFLARARTLLEPSDLRTAVMLQRGAWVARGRRYRVDDRIRPLNEAVGMKDACFSYGGENWSTATNILGYVRDFTAAILRQPVPEQIQDMVDD